MASSDNTRDVALNLRVATTGTEKVEELGKDLKNLGKAADGAAPELEALAAEAEQLAPALNEAAQAVKKHRDAENEARASVRAAKDELADKRDALNRLRVETDTATKKTAEYQAREQALKVEILDAGKALREKRNAMETATDATRRAVVAEADLQQRMTAIVTQHREATLSAAALGRAQVAGAEQAAQANSTVREGLSQIAGQFRALQTLAGAAIGGQLLGGMAGDVARTADAWANLSARMRIVVGDGEATDKALQAVVDVATRTGSALEDVGGLFTKLAQAGKDAGLSTQAATQQALGLTEAIGQATQISGASAEASQAAITQLTQALGSGTLRGDEFNSVLEQAPRLARALADGLGVTTGELRKLAEAGQLTSQTVITALQGQSATLQAEFNKLPPTIGRALTNLSSQWTEYVGRVDQANGISAAAARAINGLASNLDTLGSLLYAAGKATAAFQALRLAQTFIASTSAITAETAAVQANTAAKVANRAAAAGMAEGMATAATSAGRLAGIVSSLKTFSLVGILTSAPEIGKWLGETAAKLMGVKDRTAELEAADKAATLVAREHAQSVAALAQQHQLAENKALGLTTQARALAAEFDKARTSGDSVTEALGKIAKNLDLGSLQGIRDAGAALDSLALKGAVTGQQVRDALSKALNGADLVVFETTARAAFDGTARGAERLAAAIDAVGAESLRRAGTSVQELQTGFSTAMNSAINDTDTLAATLARLGAKGPEVGRLLAGSLDRTLDAANTERAVQAVIDRWKALGDQGLVTGQQLAQGLEQARGKLDEIRPGINSLDEALKVFSLKTRTELQQTATTYAQAWEKISTSTTVSLADKARAFAAYKEAAIAANKGVIPSEVATQEAIFRTQLTATDAGKAIAASLGLAGDAADATAEKVGRLNDQLSTAAALIPASRIADTPDKNPNPFSGPVDNSTRTALFQKFDSGTLLPSDREAALQVLAAARSNRQQFVQAGWDPTSWDQSVAKAQAVFDRINGMGSTPASSTHTVNIKIGSSTATVKTATAADATTLTDFLRQLEAAAARAA